MNTLTKYSLVSIFYLVVMVASYAYIKRGKNDRVKAVLKDDIVPVSLIMLIAFNVVGLILWIKELIRLWKYF